MQRADFRPRHDLRDRDKLHRRGNHPRPLKMDRATLSQHSTGATPNILSHSRSSSLWVGLPMLGELCIRGVANRLRIV